MALIDLLVRFGGTTRWRETEHQVDAYDAEGECNDETVLTILEAPNKDTRGTLLPAKSHPAPST